MSLLSLVGSIGGGLLNFGAAKDLAADIDKALDVQGTASRLGYNLREVYGSKPKLPKWNFTPADLNKMMRFMGNFSATQGTGNATRIAARSNEAAVAQLEAAMGKMFGGTGSFERQREAVNRNTEDMLAGRLSSSTRGMLGRRAVATGAAGLGEGAVSDIYAGYLGLSTEDIVTRGAQQYQSLYQGYRQAIPFVSAAEMMPYSTLQVGQATDARMRIAENTYSANYNRALVKAAPDPMAAGHVQAEMQRAMAVAGANYQANSQLGGMFSSAMNGLGGLMGGQKSYGFMGGSMGGGFF